LDADPSYVHAWSHHRRWFWIAVLTCVLYLPFLAFMRWLASTLGVSQKIASTLWMVVPTFAGLTAWQTRCPRCRELFFIPGLLTNPFARRCPHCGLPKWATRDPDQAAPRPSPVPRPSRSYPPP
jgi:hypothetical protein